MSFETLWRLRVIRPGVAGEALMVSPTYSSEIRATLAALELLECKFPCRNHKGQFDETRQTVEVWLDRGTVTTAPDVPSTLRVVDWRRHRRVTGRERIAA